MTLTTSMILKHYKRKDVQRMMIAEAEGKEVGVRYLKGYYGKRPDTLHYPKDVLELALKGASSFHASEESWKDPMQLSSNMRTAELDELREGWDLLLDIDCKELEYSKIVAHLIIQALEHLDVKDYAIKFSGNHGFHIGIPFKAFPEQVGEKKTKDLFPEGPRRIAVYLRELMREELSKALLKVASITELAEKCEKKREELLKNNTFDPYTVVDIDTVLISSRHLYRMPYSFNEKSSLVSVVIEPKEARHFDKKNAAYNKITNVKPFLTKEVTAGSATKLLIQAFDFELPAEEKKAQFTTRKEFTGVEEAVPEDYFPPCINKILNGLEDGKKRGLFILRNFLTSVGWAPEDIEQYLYKWNEKNPDPLREVYLKGQIKYANKKVLPPNCANKAYYIDLQICEPDNFCKRIKNPANYAILKQKLVAMHEKKKKKVKNEPKNTKSRPKKTPEHDDTQE